MRADRDRARDLSSMRRDNTLPAPDRTPQIRYDRLWRFLIGGDIQRHRGAANGMPGGNPADESPRVVAPLSKFGHSRATDLKSANAVNRDRPLSRQLIDPALQRRRSVHGGTRQHID